MDRFSLSEQATLKSHFFIRSIDALGSDSLLLSRESARRETVQAGPCLHIIVPTLQCAHSCQYCQVSRSLTDSHHVMSDECLYKACESIFQSEAKALTVEFQGGDPLLRFDMVQAAVLYIKKINLSHHKNIRFVNRPDFYRYFVASEKYCCS
ncbi:4Fe-4S cluster-binding domain-containing protein [Paenalcaligenes suwonensis]|uniref:4Fe-4S cluster-binding domain-containing protein n=1 Tax=Paenalcaligenes suwonensis TaxID=1202713 RepID=UPI00140738EB|nr:4Fe-4S cluster-binding domain-containing protein [Paenalcaligenes suwonensis]